MLKAGGVIHVLGILGDSSFAIRIFVKKTQWFRLGALILVSIYSLLWLGWLIWLHVIVFNHNGKVCKGSYLPESEQDKPKINYAIQQGQILTNIIIGIWCSNVAIAILSVIAGICANRYLKGKV